MYGSSSKTNFGGNWMDDVGVALASDPLVQVPARMCSSKNWFGYCKIACYNIFETVTIRLMMNQQNKRVSTRKRGLHGFNRTGNKSGHQLYWKQLTCIQICLYFSLIS